MNNLKELIQKAGERYGYLELLEAFLEGCKDSDFGNDMEMPELLGELMKKNRSYTLFKYLQEDDLETIVNEIELSGRKVIKCENLAQEMRLEAFLNDMETNPCQLKLIA